MVTDARTAKQMELGGNIVRELTTVLEFVLPGLVAAWVFYGLTSYQKPKEFERLVQALVFTSLLELLARPIVGIGAAAGSFWKPLLPAGDVRMVATLLAVPFGVLIAYLANNDVIHGMLRERGITTKTGRPDQWDAAFNARVSYVVLNLRNGRRICGWLTEWPDRPNDGHFLLTAYQWFDAEGATLLPNENSGTVLICAEDVEFVEFPKT
jgi:hypothetical protein